MSYDLTVFTPREEFYDRPSFIRWWKARARWNEGLDYFNPDNAQGQLRLWFNEMIVTYPPLNGPGRLPFDHPRMEMAADYNIGTDIIYVGFSAGYSRRDAAARSFCVAEKHHIGIFFNSDDGDVWMPGPDGSLIVAHTEKPANRAPST